jgi:FkbM family methyltransferase
MSYSQLGQDIEVLKVFNHKKNGFFIEVGALDGIHLSNTYILEKNYDWKGICIEPVPSKYIELCRNRNCNLSDKAVYHTSNMVVNFDVCNLGEQISGISDHIDCHRDKVDQDKTTIQKTTITLTDLLKEFNAPTYIDYMSLDTEGSELEILKGFDFSKYIIGLIDVEHNYIEPRRTQLRDLLTSNGYHYKRENLWDDSYIHSSINQ